MQRDESIDIAKGLGIAAVVVGVLVYEALKRTTTTRALFLGVWPPTAASRKWSRQQNHV